MTRYTADSRDRVRDSVDMLALVGEHTELRRAGPEDEQSRHCAIVAERRVGAGSGR